MGKNVAGIPWKMDLTSAGFPWDGHYDSKNSAVMGGSFGCEKFWSRYVI